MIVFPKKFQKIQRQSQNCQMYIYSRLDKNCLNIIYDMRRDVQHEACSAKFMCVKIEIQFNEQ